MDIDDIFDEFVTELDEIEGEKGSWNNIDVLPLDENVGSRPLRTESYLILFSKPFLWFIGVFYNFLFYFYTCCPDFE